MRLNPDGTLGGAYYPAPQSLEGYVDDQGTVHLSWQEPPLTPNQYLVYVNEELYITLPAETLFCTIPDFVAGTYNFYVCALYSPDQLSLPSNIVTLTILPVAIEEGNTIPVVTYLEVKPNPIRNSFTISYFQDKSPAQLAIYNIRGQKVYEQTFSGGEHEVISRNLNLNLPSGVYLLKLNSQRQNYRQKITVIK